MKFAQTLAVCCAGALVLGASSARATVYNEAHGRADADRAIGAHRCVLMAVMGYSVEAPGAGRDVNGLRSRFKIRVIPRTSDSWHSDSDREFNLAAGRYAKAFNERVIAKATWC